MDYPFSVEISPNHKKFLYYKNILTLPIQIISNLEANNNV